MKVGSRWLTEEMGKKYLAEATELAKVFAKMADDARLRTEAAGTQQVRLAFIQSTTERKCKVAENVSTMQV